MRLGIESCSYNKLNLLKYLQFFAVVWACSGCSRESSPQHHQARPSASSHLSIKKQALTKKQAPIAVDNFHDIITTITTKSDSDDLPTDAWDSEIFSSTAGTRLTEALKGLTTDFPLLESQVAHLVSDDFTADALRPGARQQIYSDDTVKVFRSTDRSSVAGAVDGYGPARLCATVNALRAAYRGAERVRKKIKIVRVNFSEKVAQTRALLEVAAMIPGGAVQVSATLDCDWQITGKPFPLLTSITLIDYEEVVAQSPNLIQFRDATASIFQNNPAYRQEFLFSSDLWAQRIEKGLGSDFMGYHGVSVADIDGDGLDDVYLCQAGGLPNICLTTGAALPWSTGTMMVM